VHLNGRVYDPLVGRMMSADPFVPDPMNGQAWNRYSYVINNPLALTDTNGYCFLGMCTWGKAIGTFFGRTFGVLFRQVPILGSLFEIAAVAICSPFGGPLCASVAFAATSFVTGVTSGSLGAALRAGLIAGVTAIANFGIGTLTQGLGIPIEGLGKINPLNIAAHALVGCASSVASGGKCGPGALAGGVSAAAAPFIEQNFPNPLQNPGNLAAGTAISATVGGLASVAGGGKFANGAVTGAFGYLLNQTWHDDDSKSCTDGIMGANLCDQSQVRVGLQWGKWTGLGWAGFLGGGLAWGYWTQTPTIGGLFGGVSEDAMIHLTPFAAADFAQGVNAGTYFARLGDVAELTVAEFKNLVVGVAAPGSSPAANLFVYTEATAAGGFQSAGVSWAGFSEYINSAPFMARFLKVPWYAH
jgi:hypothetical protein